MRRGGVDPGIGEGFEAGAALGDLIQDVERSRINLAKLSSRLTISVSSSSSQATALRRAARLKRFWNKSGGRQF